MHDDLYAMRHSLAHILATAVQRLWPDAKFGVGPVIENGFYYDVDLGDQTLSSNQLSSIEEEMRRIIDEDQVFEHSILSITEAIEWATKNQQPYKLELLNDLSREGTTAAKQLDSSMMGLAEDPSTSSNSSKVKEVSFYTNGDFKDLCHGPHVSSTSKVGAFKLTRLAGAYWRGSEKNPQMTRIYGVAFSTPKQLNDHLQKLEVNKTRDHRQIGKDQDIFMSSELVGSGLPLWLENGTIIRRQIQDFIINEEIARGYTHVITPDMARLSLYEKSGHYPYYKDTMYPPIEIDGERFMLRPMNCPHHFQIYNQKPRSYRELPMRIAEFGKVYRYEKSGELSGLTRTRSFFINDGHIICRPDQAADEVRSTLEFIDYVASSFGMKKGVHYKHRLSLGGDGGDKYIIQDSKAWDEASSILRQALIDRGDEFVEVEGEAAFYGPKIDIQMVTVTGREETAFTIQYDFAMPKRFDLKFIDKDNQPQETVVIHRSLIGSLVRFMAFLLEHFGGSMPVWLSPEQLRLIPVNDSSEIMDYTNKVRQQALDLGIRAGVDDDKQSISKRIRQSNLDKIPYVVVIGEKELKHHQVTPRVRNDLSGEDAEKEMSMPDVLSLIVDDISSKRTPEVD